MNRVCLAAVVVALVGCGGSGGGGSTRVDDGTTTPAIDLYWAARSQAVNAPAAALSAVITFQQARPDGSDLSFTVNREVPRTDHVSTHVAPSPAKVGAVNLRVEFHAQAGGNGPIIGVATSGALLRADGTLGDAAGGALGTVFSAGVVKSIEVAPNQTLDLGARQFLNGVARDAQGNVVAVTPGSFSFRPPFAFRSVRLNEDGSLTGLVPGPAEIEVTMDDMRATGTVTVRYAATGPIKSINIRASRLAHDPIRGRIYALGDPTSPDRANHFVTIDASSGAVLSSVPIGSDPTVIAMSADRSAAYVGLKGSGTVRRVDLATGTAGPGISLGAHGNEGPYYAMDIAVSPTDPNLIAVVRYPRNASIGEHDVALYQNGVRVANTFAMGTGPRRLAWGPAEDRLNGIDFDFGTPLYPMTVDANGIQLGQPITNAFSGDVGDIEFSGERIYSAGGQVIDAITYAPEGTFPFGDRSRSLSAISATENRAYILLEPSDGITAKLQIFDTVTFGFVREVLVPMSNSGVVIDKEFNRMVALGNGRVALAAGNEVLLIDTKAL